MAGASGIEWTDATWNPIVGCSLKSPGCTHCYAMGQAHRLASNPATPHYAGSTRMTKGGPVFTGAVALASARILTAPPRRMKPTMWFVNSMGDLFHENVPDDWIDKVFAMMAVCGQHTFQVLTKRAERMRSYIHAKLERAPEWVEALPGELTLLPYEGGWPTNVWLGVSAEDQTCADERIPLLLDTPAAVRFVSAEPLLGPIDLTDLRPGFDWVIVGGESGKDARPMHPDWARSLRDQCAGAGVPFFFKQWGAWLPWEPEHAPCWVAQNGRSEDHHRLFPAEINRDPNWDDGLWAVAHGASHAAFQRVGKKAAGALLDGVEHRAFPQTGDGS